MVKAAIRPRIANALNTSANVNPLLPANIDFAPMICDDLVLLHRWERDCYFAEQSPNYIRQIAFILKRIKFRFLWIKKDPTDFMENESHSG